MTARTGHWMQVHSGKCFYPLDPRPEDVDIFDIAHALSNTCRYGGHSMRFYSVAEHSVLVSRHVRPQFALWGLLHDAAEAYVGDLIRPLKMMLPEFAHMEQRVMVAIGEKFGLDFPEPPEVTEIDNRILADEQATLMATCEQEWHLPYAAIGGVEINCWSPGQAKMKFLELWFELRDKP